MRNTAKLRKWAENLETHEEGRYCVHSTLDTTFHLFSIRIKIKGVLKAIKGVSYRKHRVDFGKFGIMLDFLHQAMLLSCSAGCNLVARLNRRVEIRAIFIGEFSND